VAKAPSIRLAMSSPSPGERINELADHPEFYNLLTNSCTINIVRYANAAGRGGGFDIRHILNGLVDCYLYYSGRIDATIDELRRRSLINDAARAADGAPDFSERVRASLSNDLPLKGHDTVGVPRVGPESNV
jgi:hypothetical protein